MKTEITISKKQADQFNLMRQTLNRIAKDYQTPTQLRKGCKSDYGLDFEETIEMAYENIQSDAKFACGGVKSIVLP